MIIPEILPRGSTSPACSSQQRGFGRPAAVLAVFVVVYLFLAVGSYRNFSACFDEPIHLATGFAVLSRGDHRLMVGHPPAIRAWAALPLLFTPDVRLNSTGFPWSPENQLDIASRFLYLDNDGDPLLYKARFMIVLLGVLLGVLLFLWSLEWWGLAAATAVLVCYCLEPNLLAHACLVTTDMGVTLFFFATAYALWHVLRRATPVNVTLLAVSCGLAQASKYSALLLAPAVALCLACRAASRSPWPVGFPRGGVLRSGRGRVLAALAILLTVAAVSWSTVWASYGFRYAPVTGPRSDSAFAGLHVQEQSVTLPQAAVRWLDNHTLLPAAYSLDLLNMLGPWTPTPSYLAGSISPSARWYFFPAVFLVKTPTILLLAIIGAAGLLIAARRTPEACGAALIVPACYALMVVTGPVNSGVRHLLPVYPFLLLMTGVFWKRLMSGGRHRLLMVLFAAHLAEFIVIYPDCLAAFNLPSGGPARGSWWLTDSNIDWGQDLKRLGGWVKSHGSPLINLSYFGLAHPRYYGIDCVMLPGSNLNLWEKPRLPGWVAVSVNNFHSPHMSDDIREFLRPLAERPPEATVGRSIRLYWITEPWWPSRLSFPPAPQPP